MKKITAPLNSKIGKRWTLDSKENKNHDIPDNFTIGMTNCQPESNQFQ